MKTTTIALLTAPLLIGSALACRAQTPGGIVLGGDDGVVGTPSVHDDPTQTPMQDTGAGNNTFDHPSDLSQDGGKDPFQVLAQRQEEGPPEIRTRLHSCNKLRIATIANILTAFGVDLGKTGDPMPAGQLLAEGHDALGGANYAARTAEALTWSNSGATKLQDIFVQAAPEIIAAMPGLDQCKVNGQGTQMFDDNNHCTDDGLSCLIGKPATPDTLAICNQAVASASDPDKGKAIAVGALLSAAHSCE